MHEVELYWLPLGAGGHSVRLNGLVYERIFAALERREAQALFHAALIVRLGEDHYTIELCPEASGEHGRVAGGAVGSPLLGRLRLFRYEARCWLGGTIPDLDFAVGSPTSIRIDSGRQLIALVPQIPTPTWGRDELGHGEMWNSNSVISWLIERAGADATAYCPPRGGRAPGWNAGVSEARRGSDRPD